MATLSNNATAQIPGRKTYPGIDLPSKIIWNKVVFDTLVSHIGAEKMQITLKVFSASVMQSLIVLQDYSVDFPRQRHEVHDLASVSGFLGFDGLFQSCLDFLSISKSSIKRREAVLFEMEIVLRELNSNKDWAPN